MNPISTTTTTIEDNVHLLYISRNLTYKFTVLFIIILIGIFMLNNFKRYD